MGGCRYFLSPASALLHARRERVHADIRAKTVPSVSLMFDSLLRVMFPRQRSQTCSRGKYQHLVAFLTSLLWLRKIRHHDGPVPLRDGTTLGVGLLGDDGDDWMTLDVFFWLLTVVVTCKPGTSKLNHGKSRIVDANAEG